MSFSRMLHSKIFLLLIIWRISSVFIVQTFHVPDEYWQSLEVAHKLAFDYGYLTWEWHTGIRSYLYPFLISILFSILKFLNLDHPSVIIYLPRIFQALLCAYAEYKFYLWTNNKFALFNLCINWYWYYCATRTLINSFETCLTIIALSQYPWKDNSRKNSNFVWTVGFLCFVRPTAAIFWLPLCLYHLSKNKLLFVRYFLVGLFNLILSSTIDILCYERFVLTPIEFFKVNVLNSISEEYGKYHFLWYFYSGLPTILGLNYIFLLFSIFTVIKTYKCLNSFVILTFTIVWSVCVFSLLIHKEFRFILPVLPMVIYVTDKSNFYYKKISESKKKLIIFLLIISNVLPGFYFSVLHQQGPLKVMNYLRNEVQSIENSKIDILYLINCHGTPYYSHLHKNISMRFLTCEPNLKKSDDYKEEQIAFFENPMIWLEENYLHNTSVNLPSHIVTFSSLSEQIRPFLRSYEKITSIPDMPFAQDENSKKFDIYRRH